MDDSQPIGSWRVAPFMVTIIPGIYLVLIGGWSSIYVLYQLIWMASEALDSPWLVMAVSYFSLFAAGVCWVTCSLLVLRDRWRNAGILGVAGIIGVGCFFVLFPGPMGL